MSEASTNSSVSRTAECVAAGLRAMKRAPAALVYSPGIGYGHFSPEICGVRVFALGSGLPEDDSRLIPSPFTPVWDELLEDAPRMCGEFASAYADAWMKTTPEG